MPHLEVPAHVRAPKIEVAIREPQVLVDLVAARVVERKRRGVGDVVGLECGRVDLDLARRQRRVFRAHRPPHHLAGDTDDRLRLQMLQLFAQHRVFMRLELNLRDALAVAQVDENDAALVANGVDPAEEGHGCRRSVGVSWAQWWVRCMRMITVENPQTKRADAPAGKQKVRQSQTRSASQN